MSYITEIFKRTTIKEITGYLLYGTTIEENEDVNYQTRLENAYRLCEKTLLHYETDKESDLFHAVHELMNEYEKIYMEIGFHSGLLLMHDALKQVK